MFVFKADNMPLHQSSQYSRIIIAKNIRMAPQLKKKAQISAYLQLLSHNN